MTRIERGTDLHVRRQISAFIQALEAAGIIVSAPVSALPASLVLTAGANVTLTPGPGTMTVAASGGGGGGKSGNTIIDFAAEPGHIASVTLTGLAWVTGSSNVTATVLAKPSTQYNAYTHRVIASQVGLSVSDYVAGVGFTIHCVSNIRLNGEINVSYAGA